MLLGYARVSRDEQDTAAHVRGLRKDFREKASGGRGPARATKAGIGVPLVSKVGSEDVVKSSDLIDRMKPSRWFKRNETAADAARLFNAP